MDVAIIGAGPAGLAAAAVTGGAGLSTLVLDEQPTPGGQIWRAADSVAAEPERWKIFAGSFAGAAKSLDAARAVATLQPQSDIVDISPEREILWFDRAANRLRETKARALVLTSGALERPVPLPGWTLPGVMGVGALQIAMKQSMLVPDGPVVLAGQGPLLLLVTRQLQAMGAQIATILDFGGAMDVAHTVRTLPKALFADAKLVADGVRLAARRALGPAKVYRAVRDIAVLGDREAEGVRFRAGGKTHEVTASLVALHDGVTPNTQLSRLLGLTHAFREADAAFAPVLGPDGASSVDGVWVAGDAAGIGGAALARARGMAVGAAVGEALTGRRPSVDVERARRLSAARPLVEGLYKPLPVSTLATSSTVLCRCERVTVGAIRGAVKAGANGPNRVKTATRCGMGPCQGRLCGGPLTRLIAEETGRTPDAVGALRIRAPLKPILLGDYASLATEPANP